MRWYKFCLLFVALILSAAALAPAQAQDKAAGDPFTVSDVKVDASGASATEAFNIAVSSGRRKAWATLVHRLTRETDWGRIPDIDDATLQRMTRGYQVSDERRSTTRYVADVTYTFNGDAVRRFLRSANIAYATSASPPMLVVPLAPGYESGSAWTAAWAGNRMAAGAVPLDLPAGDALDKSVLGLIDFDGATWNDVQPAASRAHAAQAALVLAGPVSNGHIPVRIRILSAGLPQTLPPLEVPVTDGAPADQVYAAAANAAARAIGDAWTARSAIDFNQHSTLSVDVAVDSLNQWGAIQQRLETVPVVTNINVAAMNIGHARLVLSYAGTTTQLGDFLSQAALSLTSRNGVWWLAMQPGGTR